MMRTKRPSPLPPSTGSNSVDADRGAVVLKPVPPRKGTFSLLIPGDLGWEVTREAGYVRIDFRPLTRTEKRSAYAERLGKERAE